MRETKQVIIIRRDLKMRRGKEIAQGCHASMGALLSLFKNYSISYEISDCRTETDIIYGIDRNILQSVPVMQWLENSFTKITCYVESEPELLFLEQAAKQYQIPHCLITDNGKTEFAGVPTITCLAIGPWWSDEIDNITKYLKLY